MYSVLLYLHEAYDFTVTFFPTESTLCFCYDYFSKVNLMLWAG